MKTEIYSPAPKTEGSIHKMSRSVNDTYNSKNNHRCQQKSVNALSKDNLLKMEGKRVKSDKNKSKSQIMLKSRSPQHKLHSDSHKKIEVLST